MDRRATTQSLTHKKIFICDMYKDGCPYWAALYKSHNVYCTQHMRLVLPSCVLENGPNQFSPLLYLTLDFLKSNPITGTLSEDVMTKL